MVEIFQIGKRYIDLFNKTTIDIMSYTFNRYSWQLITYYIYLEKIFNVNGIITKYLYVGGLNVTQMRNVPSFLVRIKLFNVDESNKYPVYTLTPIGRKVANIMWNYLSYACKSYLDLNDYVNKMHKEYELVTGSDEYDLDEEEEMLNKIEKGYERIKEPETKSKQDKEQVDAKQ